MLRVRGINRYVCVEKASYRTEAGRLAGCDGELVGIGWSEPHFELPMLLLCSHPDVLINCGLDPDEYQGFAWGMGVDRLAILKYGIPDLRDFFSSDARWLDHYGLIRSISQT